ncbi:MAG: S8 family serine peptidase [Verrucomicrobiota bacterium]|jgi:hypothetical protein|nr:S8 family serine peptidase [Verrucomicrobiota bacterium]
MVPTVHALYFRLDGDRLWLQAVQTPLVEILDQFSRAGVNVFVDPSIQTTVNGNIRGGDLDESLPGLLEAYDYLLTWKILRGPLGRVPKLKEIRIFSRGRASAARPLPKRSTSFDVTRGVTGTQPEFVKDELLVGVHSGTTYRQFQSLLDQIGGMIVDSQDGIYLIRFPPGTNVEALLEQLQRNAMIAHAELNYASRIAPNEFAALPPAGLPPIVPPADGSIPVAVLDSGLHPQAGLSAVLHSGLDALDPSRTLSDPDGHGTHMAYLVSGLFTADGIPPTDGPLPLVAIRAFDENGLTSNFALLQALAHAKQAGVKVVNMSWGSDVESLFMQSVIREAAQQGLLLVAAAGNTPSGKEVYPAAYPEVLAVGATEADGRPWSQSNYGRFVDLSAPARATFPTDEGGKARYVGTSISSAVVAHALGQYFNQHPNASASEAVQALRHSLSPAPAPGWGQGIFDRQAQIRLLGR